MAAMPTREDAWALVCELNETERMRKHALAVEAVMRYMARKRGADVEEWGLVGLVHDLDFERYPEQHCAKTRELLQERGWPEPLIRAAVSHGFGVCCDVEPVTDLEKTLFAVDELTGLVAATALVRPSRSVHDLSVKSVKKKWKEKQFAAGVDRGIIEKGAAMLGVEVTALIEDCIAGMRQAAPALGLQGEQG